MSVLERFSLPDVGEGLTEAEVVRWRVAVGDAVAVNDPVVEVETAKSVVELPSPYAGVVQGLLVEEGATVAVGTPLLAVTTQGAATTEDGAPAQERTSVLVGYGPRAAPAPSRRRRHHLPSAGARAGAQAEAGASLAGAVARGVLAKPPVRALARHLGVDLADVAPTGTGGVVTRDDLLAHATAAPRPAPRPAPAGGAPSSSPSPSPSSLSPSPVPLVEGPARDGSLDLNTRETRVPVRGVRRATAQQMVASAFTAPHATAFVTVDATRTMKLLDRLRADREYADVHVSPLLVVCRAVCLAVARNPGVNASWDEVAQEIVLKHYVNLGIAVATPRGLLVPSVKDADALPLHRLAGALGDLVRTARDGRASPADLSGSTISVTNIGVFGVDSGTPILNPGEAVILCVGAVRRRPWVHKGRVRPRWVVELSVSFDHRLVDGDLGSRFLADVAAVLERPDTALRWT